MGHQFVIVCQHLQEVCVIICQYVQEALSGSMHEACQQASSKLLEEEDGVGVAVEFIHQHMQKHAAVPQLGNLKLPANSNREAEDDFDQVTFRKMPVCS